MSRFSRCRIHECLGSNLGLGDDYHVLGFVQFFHSPLGEMSGHCFELSHNSILPHSTNAFFISHQQVNNHYYDIWMYIYTGLQISYYVQKFINSSYKYKYLVQYDIV